MITTLNFSVALAAVVAITTPRAGASPAGSAIDRGQTHLCACTDAGPRGASGRRGGRCGRHRGGAVVRGPRGGVAAVGGSHYHGGYRHGGYYHGGRYYGGGAWVRPYRWAPGGAIAAGAAIGFVTTATAAAWASAPPQPGLCWYYTDPSQRAGFWDTCPR